MTLLFIINGGCGGAAYDNCISIGLITLFIWFAFIFGA
jgi:hypothetical protein